jgi:Na+/H+ antiporter NhaD/arsenite permease-like protein
MIAFSLLASTKEVSTSVTVTFALILVGLIACLALEEKLHAKKSVIAGIFAIISLIVAACCQILPLPGVVVGSMELVEHNRVEGTAEDEEHTEHVEVDAISDGEHAEHDRPVYVDGHRLAMPIYIPGIDWGVIAIILGSSLFVDVTSKSGLFTWIAVRVTKASKGDPLRLLWSYGIMTVVFSAVLNNVTAMIIVGSLTVVSLDKLGRREQLLGFLLIEGLLTNIGGLLTLISSVPNIIVGNSADISFVSFFVKAAPYVFVTTIATIAMGAKMFHIQKLNTEEEKLKASELVGSFDENDGVASRGFFWFSTSMLIAFILIVATLSMIPYINTLGMGFVALTFAGIQLIRYKSEVDQFYKSIDWDLIGFFMALFVVIYVMEYAHVLHAIGDGLQWVLADITANTAGVRDASVLLVGSAAFSSVTDNIPLSAMLSNILTTLETPKFTADHTESGLWWSVIFGSNLGGNLTPIGSASTLVAVTIMHKHDLHVSFGKFVVKAFPFAIMHIVLAVIYVVAFLR